MIMASRSNVLAIYKALLRESNKFTGYNFRTYALRRTRDAFKENKMETDSQKIAASLQEAERNLEIIKRQTTISQMYREPTLVIEKQKP